MSKNKMVAALLLLIGGAVAGNLYGGLSKNPTGEMFQLLLPIIALDVVIIVLGLFALKKS